MSKIVEVPGVGNVEFPDEMSDDAIGAALAKNSSAPAAAPAGPSPTRWSQKLGEGALPGFTRLVAAGQAAIDPLIPGRTKEWGEDYGTRYAEHLKAEQGQSSQTTKEHPWPSAALQTFGALPSAVAMGAPAGILGGLKAGAGAGAMYGAGETRAKDVGGVLVDTGVGAATGAAASLLPHALLAGENLARTGATKLLPRITPTPSARVLLNEGVPLTVGQIAGPETAIGQYESVSANNPMGMGKQREAAKLGFMRAAQDKGVAPGEQAPTNPDLQGRLGELFKGFGPAYDKIRDVPINPEVVATLPDAAAMPSRGVDARTAAGVKAEVKNALSILGFKPAASGHAHGHGAPAAPEAAPPGLVDQYGVPIPPEPKPPAPPPKATAGDLLDVRENIRKNIRAERGNPQGNADKIRLLKGAEKIVTDAIDSNLPPEAQQHLRDTDRQYARLMLAAEAAPVGQTEFTPLQYLRRVGKASGLRAFKTGQAGDTQDLGEAARKTLVDAPMTGYRGAVLSTIPYGHKLVGPVAAWANTPGVKAALLRSGSPTLPTPNVVSPKVNASIPTEVEALIAALRNRLGVQGVPAAADEDQSR